MPLPTSNAGAWPPTDLKPYIDRAAKNGAWYSGDTALLEATSGQAAADSRRRRFWQRRGTSDATKATPRVHAPLAADIAQVSSDLLFGDPIILTTPDGETGTSAQQEQLDTLTEQIGLHNRLAEAAETSAAYGGCYLTPAWDTDVADHPLLAVYDQRHAIPDFRYGVLTGVSLWEDVYTDASTVWRHLERHEPGRILHGLYKGTKTELGAAAPLSDHPDTETLKPEVLLTGRLAGRLLPAYVPNVLPNRNGRKPIGRSDWEGSDDLLDAVDEVWTSLMRDFRLGQAHVFVPQEWLQALGGKPGQQQILDLDQEVFTGLNIADAQTQKMETWQADVRVDSHISALLALTERIVSAGGYAPQSFGLQIDGTAQSGTALRIREGKSDKLTAKKQRYYGPQIIRTVDTLLAIGAEVFNQPAPGESVNLEWPEADRDPTEKATWISTLRQAQAMSIESAVRVAQPHLDDDRVDAEVALIKAENAVADPFPLG